ncbi:MULTISPECIES: hypothetical protein [unclassified Micromonospora]
MRMLSRLFRVEIDPNVRAAAGAFNDPLLRRPALGRSSPELEGRVGP